jgi:hypothetical protein
VPLPHAGPYAFEASVRPVFSSFGQYWLLVLSLTKYAEIHGLSRVAANVIAVALAIGLILALGVCVRQRYLAPLFWFCVYVVALVPYVGFRQHVMNYYLFLPSAALALLVARILDKFCGSTRTTVLALCAIAAYSALTISTALFIRDWNF